MFAMETALIIGRCTTKTQKTQPSYKPKTPSNKQTKPPQNPIQPQTVCAVHVNSNPPVLGSQDIWKIGVCTKHTALWAAQAGCVYSGKETKSCTPLTQKESLLVELHYQISTPAPAVRDWPLLIVP